MSKQKNKTCLLFLFFEFRVSDLFRISMFEIRILELLFSVCSAVKRTPMRRLFSLALVLALAFVCSGPALSDAPDKQVQADEQTLKGANLKTDGEALLDFFRKRTLESKDRAKVATLIEQLGSPSYRERVQAFNELVSRGPVVSELLREAMKAADLEVVRRAALCLERIQAKDVALDVPAAAARLLAVRKPARAIEVLLAYLPYADNDSVAEESRTTLAALAVQDGKPSPLVIAALGDSEPIRRAAAGEVLIRAKVADQKPAVRKLLDDPHSFVRLRVALALIFANEKDAVPVLINALPDLALGQAWQAEDVLYRLADGKTPPSVSLGTEKAAREKFRDAWLAWWQKNHKDVDLAKLKETPRLLGYTVVVLLDQGKVIELDTDNQPRWQIDNLVYPLDVQPLPGDRVLVAEYHGSRVTERKSNGEILWQKRIVGPLMAQRLANGNTFIGTDSQLLEVDPTDREVFRYSPANGERMLKAMKLPNGEVAVLTTDSRVLRVDAAGKELHSFQVSLGAKLFGGRIHMLQNGRVLIPHNAENKVVEYDPNGKAVWEVMVQQPIAATRLSNGNTLITTMLPNRGAVEFDRHGKEVWNYRNNTRVTRAFRR
jgi:HEAT repeat protein